jgi:hypothetical protein
MKSITQQCNEVTGILEQLQACVDRRGNVIPARADDFAVYINRARAMMGVSAEQSATLDDAAATPIKLEPNGVWIGAADSRTWYPVLNFGQIPTHLRDEMQRRLDAHREVHP